MTMAATADGNGRQPPQRAPAVAEGALIVTDEVPGGHIQWCRRPHTMTPAVADGAAGSLIVAECFSRGSAHDRKIREEIR